MPGGWSRSPREGRARLGPTSPPAPLHVRPVKYLAFVKPPCFENSSFLRHRRAMAVQVSTSRLIVTFARRGLVTQARSPIRDSFVLGPAHRAHTSKHAIPVEEPAAHSVAPGVRLWSRSKKLWQVQEVPTHTANIESLVTVAQNLPNTSQPSRLARGRLSRAWSEATWSDVVHSK